MPSTPTPETIQEFVAAALQLVAHCEVEDYELRAIRKISRKQTRMIRKAKENRPLRLQ